MRPILSPEQWQRWQEACKGAPESRGGRALTPAASPAKPAATPATQLWEPEDYERAISDYLEKQAAQQRATVHGYMTLQADDAVRVAGLPAENSRRLRTAARGAAEAWLTQWRIYFEQSVRTELSETDARTIKQRLEGIDLTNFPRYQFHAAASHFQWTAAVARELTPSQKAVWQKEVDLRTAFRVRAIGALVLAEFDRKTLLSKAQSEQLEPRLVETIDKFEGDIQNMFSFSGDTEWYQESWVMLMPLAGMTEQLTAMLGPEQMARWKGSNEFSNAASNWANIEQMRRVRSP